VELKYDEMEEFLEWKRIKENREKDVEYFYKYKGLKHSEE
jgi:hypothetical protein